MTRKDQIIKELETIHGIELDNNFDTDRLCDSETCRNSECFCWSDLRNSVESQLEDQVEKQKLQGSISVWDLQKFLDSVTNVDMPVFVNGLPIDESYFDGEAFQITTRRI